MSTTYTYQREIYDQTSFLTYIKNTLNTASNTYISNGSINIVFPSAITKITLDSLVANYTNFSLQVNTTPFRNISIGNSTSNILLATSNYTGYFEDVSEYASITSVLYSDVPSNSNGFIYQFSTNGSNVDITQQFTAKSNGYLQTYPTICRYFRVSYSNGNVAQSSMRLQTSYNYYKNATTGQFASDILTDSSYLQVSKNILTGRNTFSNYENISSVNNKISVNVPITAQGVLATANILPLIQIDFPYSLNSEITLSNNILSGTVALSNNLCIISSGAAINSVGSLNSKRYIRYRAGQGINILAACIFAPGITGNTQLLGFGNSVDGLFYGYTGSNFGILRRYNSVDTWTLQSNWNCDKFDGTGPSGMNLNTQFGNTYVIQQQWPFGIVNFQIVESSTGSKYIAHRLSIVNNSLTTLTQNPTYPLLITSSNSTSTSNVSIRLGNISAHIEGSLKILGPRLCTDNTKSLNTNSYVNIITIKNKTTFNSKPNYISSSFKSISAGTDSRQAVITLFRNAIVAGTPVFTDYNTTLSTMQIDTSGTTVTGGIQLHTTCLGLNANSFEKFDDFEITLEPGDTMTLCARIPASAGTNVSVSVSWIEDQ